MLNKTNLARIDLNLLVLFEAVLEERHVGARRGAPARVAVGGQPRPRIDCGSS